MKVTKLIFSDSVFYSLIVVAVIMILVGSIGAINHYRSNFVTYDDYQVFTSNEFDNINDYIEQVKNEMLLRALESTKSEPNFTDVVAQSIKSVVHIKCPRWQGSGFVISKHIIATARHVVEGVEDFEITFNCGNKTRATRAISDKKHDIAFIWVDCELPDWMVVDLGSIKDCKLGEDVFAVGSPYGKINFNSVTKGIISGLNRTFDFTGRMGNELGWEISFTTDAAGHPGNSGGPVFTMDGKVRGILVGGASPVLVVVMPVDIFVNDIEQIRLMFLMDKYQFEEEPEYSDAYYNYKDDNEYYRNEL